MEDQPDTPPFTCNPDGNTRRVGVEIEFAGLSVQDVAPLVKRRMGGEIRTHGSYRAVVEGTTHGDFVVELDTQYAHAKGDGDMERALADAAGAIGELFVPVEIVAPPIPYTDLDVLDRLVNDIRRHGAEGTQSGLFAAYGCHLNPEVAETGARYLTAMLKAYLILSAWLRDVTGLDFTRQVTSFVDPFPASYARRVVSPDYWPGMDDLIDDYLADNPTRNRELDMLPLFAHIDADRVRARIKDDRIKARPTFHYRLPNSEVDAPYWTVSGEWRHWVRVERLAADDARLEAASRAFSDFHDRPLALGWAKEAAKWAS